MNTEPNLRVIGRRSTAGALTGKLNRHGRPIYADEFRGRVRMARQRYFFLGWCAGALTILIALWLIPYVEACGDLPPPDTTIEQISAPAL